MLVKGATGADALLSDFSTEETCMAIHFTNPLEFTKTLFLLEMVKFRQHAFYFVKNLGICFQSKRRTLDIEMPYKQRLNENVR